MRYVRDTTGRFSQRPHYDPAELDIACEKIISDFLCGIYGEVLFPVSTDDLTKLIERDTDDFDLYADLTPFGDNVEGITEFRPGKKPLVKISQTLSENERRENRLRTTLTHEYGHVHFHSHLWESERRTGDVFSRQDGANKIVCKRDGILNAPQADWMEWQAGYVCGAILMPASQVRRVARECQEQHGFSGVVGEKSPYGRVLIDALVNAFQVSEDASRVRLFKLNLLTVGDHINGSLF